MDNDEEEKGEREHITSTATYRGIPIYSTDDEKCVVDYIVLYKKDSLQEAKDLIDELMLTRLN